MTPSMTLVALLLVPAVAAALAAVAGRAGRQAPRWVVLAGLVLELLLVAALASSAATGADGPWLARLDFPWIPQLGIALLLGVDGLSLLLVALVVLLGLAAIAGADDEIEARSGLFHCSLMACLTGAIGVFLALDLFLLLVFWQATLVPLFLLVRVWGQGDPAGAALRLSLFNGTGGVFLLMAIVGLALAHDAHTGAPSFSYLALRGTPLNDTAAMLLMLAFLAGCFLRLPTPPLHTWFPEAQACAPASVGALVAGVLLTTGGYGLLRFLWPLFPEATALFAPIGLGLGVIGVLYGAALACAQSGPGRRLAYLGVAHMGFVVMGVFAATSLALYGVVMQLLGYGLCAVALLLIAARVHVRRASPAPPGQRGLALLFALSLLGLPGLAGFMGLAPVLLGTYRVSATASVLAAVGLVPIAVGALGLLPGWGGDRAAAGDAAGRAGPWRMPVLALLAAVVLWLGLRPGSVFDLVAPALALVTEASGQGGGP